jgi:rhodanese-related sulfurtransferase
VTADDLLAAAHARLRRLSPAEAADAAHDGAYLVDTRPQFQREADGEIPGAIVIERNHLEWRLDPSSGGRVPEATDSSTRWIVVCDEGYSSALAAVSLREAGLHNATDVVGGFQAWRAAGLPVVLPATPTQPRLSGEGGRVAQSDPQ